MPDLYRTEADWPSISDTGQAAWTEAQARLFENAEHLAKAIDSFPTESLPNTVPGREYDFYHLFHGIVQHSLYHGGQIAILKTAAK